MLNEEVLAREGPLKARLLHGGAKRTEGRDGSVKVSLFQVLNKCEQDGHVFFSIRAYGGG